MKKCSVDDLEKALAGSGAQVLDVREPSEFESERLEGVKHYPLSAWKSSAAAGVVKDKPLYLLCLSGGRACKAAEKLEQEGFRDLYVVEGGLSAWKQAGKPLKRGQSRGWSLERQVRFAAGFLVLSGILGSFWIHPGCIGLSLFVACGLIFSAVTDTCGMGMLLARMPWNQRIEKGKV